MAKQVSAAAVSADKFVETLKRVIESLNEGAAQGGESPRLLFPHGINEITLSFQVPSRFELSIKGPASSGNLVELTTEGPYDAA